MRTFKRTRLIFVSFFEKVKFLKILGRQVIEYWINHSHNYFNRRKTMYMKDEENKMKIVHPKHFVDTTQSESFEAFKK